MRRGLLIAGLLVASLALAGPHFGRFVRNYDAARSAVASVASVAARLWVGAHPAASTTTATNFAATVTVLDQFDAGFSTTANVTLTIDAGAGNPAPGATLSNGSMAAVAGVAAFTTLQLDRPGVYSLEATSADAGLLADRTTAFKVEDKAAWSLASRTGTGTTGECACSAPTAIDGGALTVTRATATSYCVPLDGGNAAACGNNVLHVRNSPDGISAIDISSVTTNLVVNPRDLSQVANWTASNVTATLTATGITGAANSASRLTATNANGTILQALTTSGSRTTSIYVKRVTGTGNIDITRDNGSTWTTLDSGECFNLALNAVNLSTSWARCQLTSTVTNPTIGLRIVTSGDAIDVDFAQDEARAFAGPPTVGVANDESVTFATPLSGTPATWCFAASGIRRAGWTDAAMNGTIFVGGSYGLKNSWQFRVTASTRVPAFVLYDSAAASKQYNYPALAAGAHHLRICNEADGTVSYYLDGVLTAADSTSGAGTSIIDAYVTTIRLGSFTANSHLFNGRLWNVCVSTSKTVGCQGP